MNVAAVAIFIVRTHVDWWTVGIVGVAAMAGGQLGVFLLRRINITVLRIGITVIGVLLTVGLFWRA
jgi:uncharacterized membrane protein YfcA